MRRRRPGLETVLGRRALPWLRIIVAAGALLTGPAAADTRPVAGVDLSFQPQWLAAGAVYRDGRGPQALLPLLYEQGFRLVRLRLWHRPADGWCGLTPTLELARTCHAAGFRLCLDLHYADTWADPGRQPTPAAWRGLSLASLADSVRTYTANVLGAFRDAGVPLAYVQLGNEIDNGLLWDTGRIGGAGSEWDTPSQRAACAQLVGAAADGARQALPPRHGTQLVVQAAAGGDSAACTRLFGLLQQQGVDFDVIAVSYYPWWHGDLAALETNLRTLARRFGKPVLVAETAYPWTLAWQDQMHNIVGLPSQLLPGLPATPDGQAAFAARLRQLVATVPGGLGVIWWAPDLIPVSGGPGSPWENLTLFDFNGAALPALRALGSDPPAADQE
jgi:arabinogalactan endo-1,4-beta-galactosidase